MVVQVNREYLAPYIAQIQENGKKDSILTVFKSYVRSQGTYTSENSEYRFTAKNTFASILPGALYFTFWKLPKSALISLRYLFLGKDYAEDYLKKDYQANSFVEKALTLTGITGLLTRLISAPLIFLLLLWESLVDIFENSFRQFKSLDRQQVNPLPPELDAALDPRERENAAPLEEIAPLENNQPAPYSIKNALVKLLLIGAAACLSRAAGAI